MESFRCGGEWIDFSNGATESLFEEWERLARAESARPGMSIVAAYLRQALDRGGPGARSFGMDRELLPDELLGPEETAALLTLVERTAADPTVISDVNWSPDLIDSWRRRLVRMAEALRALPNDRPCHPSDGRDGNDAGRDVE